MSAIAPDDRVRLLGEDETDTAKRVGTGTVVSVISPGDSDPLVVVRWDGRWEVHKHPLSELEVVTIVCSYRKQKWVRGRKFGITGMVLLCDVHGAPGAGEVYEVTPSEVPTVTARCAGPWTDE